MRVQKSPAVAATGPETTKKPFTASVPQTCTPCNTPAALDVLLARLQAVRRTRRGWLARCPGHRDQRPSLSIALADNGKVLLHCFAGCPPEAVLAAVGLTWRDISRPATREERLEAHLRRQLDKACFRAAARLAEWARLLDVTTYHQRYYLAKYLHWPDYLDWLRERLFADDPETRLQALKEAEPWL
ncbi:MAG TPA: hypothetical protein GXX55_03515 [Firmicutes bacterium]|nr:hypothetical protein [Bacillota bacterium]